MSSDNLHLKRKKQRERRKKDNLIQKSNTWLVVCEGKKTEPNYFEEAVKIINESIPPEYQFKVEIIGKGMNTTSLVKSAEELQVEVDKHINRTVPYGKTFVVFDKDSFSDDEFNKAIDMCYRNGFIPLWSNQAIEFWFLLHFNYIKCGMSRKDYSEKISLYFKNKGLNYTYKKNDANIYSKLTSYGSLKIARINAQKNQLFHDGSSPAKAESCTTVNRFFDEIDERLEEIN